LAKLGRKRTSTEPLGRGKGKDNKSVQRGNIRKSGTCRDIRFRDDGKYQTRPDGQKTRKGENSGENGSFHVGRMRSSKALIVKRRKKNLGGEW